MRRFLAALILMLLAGQPALSEAEQPHEALYFYLEYCETCQPEEELRELLTGYTGLPASDFRLTGYNMTLKASREALEAVCREKGVDADKVLLPLVILDGVWYEGSQAMNYDLPRYAVETAASTETVIYELVMPACEACLEAEKLLDGLPGEAEVRLGRYSFTSPIRIIRVDISREPKLALALFDAWAVPEQDRVAPIAMAGGSYYQGVEAIEWLTRYHIKNGDSLHTNIVTLADEDAPEPVSVWMAALAGLVAGFNPCALSMLLLFLGLLLNLRRSVALYGAVFLGGKFVCYLLIGTLLLNLLQEIDTAWIAPLTRVLMTLLAVPLIILNIRDAWMARREQYGQIRNQLPAGLRKRLNGTIERLARARGGWLLPAIALLGALVAAGEFLCAGQIYLAAILSMVGNRTLDGMIDLAVYCLCFMLPSIFVTVLAALGTKKFVIADGLRRHMPAVKVVNALFFLAALAWVWARGIW